MVHAAMAPRDVKKEAVFDAAYDVFSKYGFRRTSMNDIAQAAGMSRPALYLLFDNKENLFRELAADRQNQAIDDACSELSGKGSVKDRFIAAILAYERVYYEPVSQSPHGAEIIDVNLSIASDIMVKGSDRLVGHLADAIREAMTSGELDAHGTSLKPKAFVELLMASIGGLKKSVTSNKEFRRQIKNVAGIFLASLTPHR